MFICSDTGLIDIIDSYCCDYAMFFVVSPTRTCIDKKDYKTILLRQSLHRTHHVILLHLEATPPPAF